jgi:hypothetical protein
VLTFIATAAKKAHRFREETQAPARGGKVENKEGLIMT